jgi:hypothetical protein
MEDALPLSPAYKVQPNSGFINFLLNLEVQIFGGVRSSTADVSHLPSGIPVS